MRTREYLKILYLAARENETALDDALRYLFDSEEPVTVRAVEEIIESGRKPNSPRDVTIDDVDIKAYDVLLSAVETG